MQRTNKLGDQEVIFIALKITKIKRMRLKSKIKLLPQRLLPRPLPLKPLLPALKLLRKKKTTRNLPAPPPNQALTKPPPKKYLTKLTRRSNLIRPRPRQLKRPRPHRQLKRKQPVHKRAIRKIEEGFWNFLIVARVISNYNTTL